MSLLSQICKNRKQKYLFIVLVLKSFILQLGVPCICEALSWKPKAKICLPCFVTFSLLKKKMKEKDCDIRTEKSEKSRLGTIDKRLCNHWYPIVNWKEILLIKCTVIFAWFSLSSDRRSRCRSRVRWWRFGWATRRRSRCRGPRQPTPSGRPTSTSWSASRDTRNSTWRWGPTPVQKSDNHCKRKTVKRSKKKKWKLAAPQTFSTFLLFTLQFILWSRLHVDCHVERHPWTRVLCFLGDWQQQGQEAGQPRGAHQDSVDSAGHDDQQAVPAAGVRAHLQDHPQTLPQGTLLKLWFHVDQPSSQSKSSAYRCHHLSLIMCAIPRIG